MGQQNSAAGEQQWNPRFVAFAASRGQTPEQASADAKARRTGRMMEFILWVNAKWTEWRALNKRERFSPLTIEDHAAFDAWLVQA